MSPRAITSPLTLLLHSQDQIFHTGSIESELFLGEETLELLVNTKLKLSIKTKAVSSDIFLNQSVQ